MVEYNMNWYQWLAIIVGFIIVFSIIKCTLNLRFIKPPNIIICSHCKTGIVEPLDSGTYWCSNQSCTGTEDEILGVAAKSFGETYVNQIREGYGPALSAMPKPREIWQHYNGCKYEILYIANIANKNKNYPVTIVYKTVCNNNNIWTKKLSDWHRSMTLVKLAK